MPPHRREQEAAEAVVAAAAALGVEARTATNAGGPDVIFAPPGGPEIEFEVKVASLVSIAGVVDQARHLTRLRGGEVGAIIVADRVTASARQSLNQAGVGWLDLRGHLRLVGPGLFIDAAVPAFLGEKAERSGVVGQVGIELAALLLNDPGRRIGVRTAAAELSRAPSSISEAFRAMRAADLVDVERRPDVPGLFWELVEHWKPIGHDVAHLPRPGQGRENAALHLGLSDVESTTGWALTDTVAAAVYGAPVGIRADYPPDLYVPDQSTLRRAVQLLGSAPAHSSRAGRVRVAPVSAVCARRVDGSTLSANEHWPLAQPLFVALDLAQDAGRGREILDGWTPSKPGHRVW